MCHIISEVQDILSYHFCFQCAPLCISFLFQLLNVTAFKNLRPVKHKSKLKLLSNFNYILPKPKWGEENIYCNCNIFIIMIFINVSFIVNLTIGLTSLLN